MTLLDAAEALLSSLKFCFSCSSELAKISKANSEVGPDEFNAVAARLRQLAEIDFATMHKLTVTHIKTSTPAWWLLANLALTTSILMALSSSVPLGLWWSIPLTASINFIAILGKTGGMKAFDNFSGKSLQAWLSGHCRLLLAAAMMLAPLLFYNVVVWSLVHGILAITASFWPKILIEPQFEQLHYLGVAATSYWVIIKLVMLAEVLINHTFYRSKLAQRRKGSPPSFSYHAADAFYGFSYTILGFIFGWTVLQICVQNIAAVMAPLACSPIGIFMLLFARASLVPLATKGKSVMYFCVHRLLHTQPFYACWHKEHHFSASQTCLTACQESGLMESAVEALYVQLVYVLVPFFDNSAYVWASTFNSLNHHYYDEYKHLHWKIVKHMLLLQRRVKGILGKLETVSVPGEIIAENLQYPSEDYKSPHLGLGSIEHAWHGQHHWTTNRKFGYGTFDSVSNLGCNTTVDKEKREADLVAFLKEYHGMIVGTINTTSLVNK